MRRLGIASILIAAASLSVGLGQVAQAADLPPRPAYTQPVIVAPAFSWTGFYLGGNVGGAWANGDVLSNFGSTWATSNAVFIGGGQAGFNYQMGGFVAGVEGDFDFTTGGKSSGFVDTVPYGLLQAVPKWNWIATAAARLGIAMDRTLFYGKFGYGWSETSLTLQNLAGTSFGLNNNTNSGWLAGAGGEYAYDNNWSFKLEYNYLNLSDRTFIITAPNAVTVKPNIQLVKTGVNYRF